MSTTELPTHSALQALAVCVGACAGALLRWRLAVWLNESHGTLPLGTLVANLSGGLLIGVALGVLQSRPELSPLWKLVIVTGFLGALTTFSTFSAESLQMLQAGRFAPAILHSAAHGLGSLLLAWLGYATAMRWLR